MFDPFRWKFPIGRVFGITIYVHYLFLIVLVPMTLAPCFKDTTPPGTWIDACLFALITSLSILLHEFGHSFGARAVGGESDQIMLWPLGGVAEISFMPAQPRAHFVMVACGPLVNLALCVAAALVLAFAFDPSVRPTFNPLHKDWYPFRNFDGTYTLWGWNGEALTSTTLAMAMVQWVFVINWFLMLFNVILVGLPWDGGAMMRAVLWKYVGYHQATMYMITTGFICAAVLFMASFFRDTQVALTISLAIYTFLMCYREWVLLESRNEDLLFGYDFSQGYTSLEKDNPQQTPARKKQNFIQRYLQQRRAKKLQREQEQQEAEERRMDELLEKIQRLGKASLTDEETRFLKRVSDRYRNRH